MKFLDFTITVERKIPPNTLGVYDEWYFGKLDGVKVGNPCQSEDVSRAEIVDMLNSSEPTVLDEMLQRDIELFNSYLTDGTRPELNEKWRKERDIRSAVLTKVLQCRVA